MTIITQTGNDSVHINANWNGSAYSNTSGLSEGILLEAAGTNLLADPESPATQDVTVTAEIHTLSMTGTGSVITANGTATAGAPLSFTPSAGTLTVTVDGNVDTFQLEQKHFETSFMPSGSRSATRLSCALADLGISNVTDNFTIWIEFRLHVDRGVVGPGGEYLFRLQGGARVLNVTSSGGKYQDIAAKAYPDGTNAELTILTPVGGLAGEVITYALRYESAAAGMDVWLNGSKHTASAAVPPFDTPIVDLYLGYREGVDASHMPATVSRLKFLETAESDATIEGWG